MKKLILQRVLLAVLVTALMGLTGLGWPFQLMAATDITPVPHAFYGALNHSDGSPAAAGVRLTAKVNGIEAGSLITTQAGKYGDPVYPRFLVMGVFVDGDVITFYVDAIAAVPTFKFKSGEITNLDLSYTLPAPTPTPTPTPSPTQPSGGGGGSLITPTPSKTASPTPTTPTTTAAAASVNIEIDGKKQTVLIADNGVIQNTLTINSPDGKIEFNIPAGTLITLGAGSGGGISIKPVNNPPAPPSNQTYVGQAYDCQPSGATFNPPVTLKLNYAVPSGADLSALRVAFYADGVWTMLDPAQYSVDAATRTITLKVSHFSYYAVFAQTAAATTTVPTTALTQTTAVATVTATVTATVSATTTPAPKSGMGVVWWVVIGIVVVLLALVIGMIVRRRSK